MFGEDLPEGWSKVVDILNNIRIGHRQPLPACMMTTLDNGHRER